jgi:hypothetical protein
MRWRKITEHQVKETILSAELIVDSFGNRKAAYKHVGDRYIKVIFVEEYNKIIVITAIDKTR